MTAGRSVISSPVVQELLDEENTGASRVLAFSFAHDTPGLVDGVAFFTPAVGDVVLSVWISVIAAFNGTTPKADVGPLLGGDVSGILKASPNFDVAQPLTDGDSVVLLHGVALPWVTKTWSSTPTAVTATVTDGTPWKVWVTQDGTAGGANPGATQGEAIVYLVVATPRAL